MSKNLLFIFSMIFSFGVFGQEGAGISEKNLFDPLLFDPLEAQTFGTIGMARNKGGDTLLIPHSAYNGDLYVPFGVGFKRMLISRIDPDQDGWQLGIEAVIFSQFEFIENRSQRNLLNADYRIGLPFYYKKGENSLRIRLFHISTHAGDDFIIRRGVNKYSPNPVNYEMLDVIYARMFNHLKLYSGAGLVVRPETIRKRLHFQLGSEYRKKIAQSSFNWILGFDCKLYQEYGFRPQIKSGMGVEFVEKKLPPISILFEFYHGNLPYSQYEDTLVEWLGMGVYLSI